MARTNSIRELEDILRSYDSRADVYRSAALRGEDNITTGELSLVYRDFPCGVSNAKNRSRYSDYAQDAQAEAVMFCAPELRILPGDEVSIRQIGGSDESLTLRYAVLGKPVVYAFHQEVSLIAK